MHCSGCASITRACAANGASAVAAPLRLFFALPMSFAAERQLLALREQLERSLFDTLDSAEYWHWIPPQNYHLTLAFLGQVDGRRLDLLHRLARTVADQAKLGEAQLDGLSWFPSPLKPRLLVAETAPCDPLHALQRLLAGELRRAGFDVDSRAFRPHISLARCKGLGAPPDLSLLALQSTLQQITCEVDELVLFSSTSGKAGRRYHPVIVEPLG